MICADKNKFTSALVNIMKNAIEAGATEVKTFEDNNAIFIENNGAPIPAEFQEKIFTEGFTTKSSGSGLGLMLTKNMLEEQGFELNIAKSTKTTFKITRHAGCHCEE